MTKYIGPKTDGENVATQADKLSLSSDTPDALTPDQSGAAGTAVTAARADHQHEILAASAGTITGTNAEGSSTSFARADHNHAFGNGSVPAAALALGPTFVTALPGSPVDGQEIYYQDTGQMATDGIVWHLRYRSGGGTYKWEFVGGSDLRAQENDFRILTNQTSFVDVPTDTITVTIPLAGEYAVTHIAWGQVQDGAGRFGVTGLAITNSSNTVQTEATDNVSLYFLTPSATGALSVTGSTTNIFTVSTAGWKLRERAKTGGNYGLLVQRRRVIVRPIRVG